MVYYSPRRTLIHVSIVKQEEKCFWKPALAGWLLLLCFAILKLPSHNLALPSHLAVLSDLDWGRKQNRGSPAWYLEAERLGGPGPTTGPGGKTKSEKVARAALWAVAKETAWCKSPEIKLNWLRFYLMVQNSLWWTETYHGSWLNFWNTGGPRFTSFV